MPAITVTTPQIVIRPEEEVTKEELVQAARALPPLPKDALEALTRALTQDQLTALIQTINALPPRGIPTRDDPEFEEEEAKDLQEMMALEPEAAIATYTYGLAPELEQLKAQKAKATSDLRAWKATQQARAKAAYEEGKTTLKAWRDQTIRELDAKIPKKTAPARLRVLADLYEAYYNEYGKLVVSYEDVKLQISKAYYQAYYELQSDYYKAYYTLKAALG